MKYKVCICEDEVIESQILTLIVKNYLESRHIETELLTYDNGESLLEDFTEGYISPDIVLMDILLPNTNGMDISKKLRSLGYDGEIVFITSSVDYAVEAFEVDARGYILKPYEPQRINHTFDRIINHSSIRTYIVQTKSSVKRIPLHEINYVESQKNKCIIHCSGGVTYTVYKKLSEIESELDDWHFLRCHQSYLVNMDAISVAETSHFILNGGEIVPIRRKESKSLRNQYISYISRE